MNITIFGEAAQALIKKSCSTLTIDEGFTNPFTIPPVIAQLRGQTKIFQTYFQQRGAQMTAVVSKIFEDTKHAITLPQISTTTAPTTSSALLKNNINSSLDSPTDTKPKRICYKFPTKRSRAL